MPVGVKPERSQADVANARIDALVATIATMKSQIATLQTGNTVLQGLINNGTTWVNWLASLTQMAHLANDNNTGGTWATGERSFYNDLKAECVSSNYMA